MSNFITHINFWVVLGFIGQFLFGSRFFYTMDCLGKARREYYSRDILVFKHGGQRHIVYVCNLPTRPGIYYGTMLGSFYLCTQHYVNL